MKKWIAILLLLVGAAIAFFMWRNHQAEKFASRAKTAIEENDFQSARVFAEKALAIRPNHTPTLLIYAESVFKDSTMDGDSRIDKSLTALGKIGDNVDESLAARKYEASLLFFSRLQAVEAEEALIRATAISTDDLEANLSLMRIYCATGRETFTSPLFETMIQISGTKSETQEVLIAWFLSQFSLGSYNSSTDQMLGVEGLYASKIPASQKRLLAFRDSEPDQIQPKVALAYWFYLRSDGKQAKVILDELDPEKIDLTDPLYLMTAVNVYLEMGEIEIAQELHGYWDNQTYFEYWRQKGVIEQDYKGNKHEAIKAFEKALTIWPGPIDPSLPFRLETCYKGIEDFEKAAEYKARGEKLRNNTDVSRIKELQQLLIRGQLDQETCEKFVAFYKSLGREIEAQYWRALPILPE